MVFLTTKDLEKHFIIRLKIKTGCISNDQQPSLNYLNCDKKCNKVRIRVKEK